MKDIYAVVLAAGKGRRMRSILPKVMHPVSGMPMVSLVMGALRKAGIGKILVVTGAGDDAVRSALPEDVSVVNQPVPAGTGHAVMCGEKALSGYRGNLLIACADMPLLRSATLKRFINAHRKSGASCTIMTGIMDNPSGYGRIVRDEKDNPVEICEDTDLPGRARDIKEVNSGMYCFRAIDLFSVLPSLNRKNRQKEIYLTDTVRILAARGHKVSAYRVRDSEEILGVNSRSDLARANCIMNRRILLRHMANGVTIIDPGSTYIDVRARIGRDTVINPFTVIDGNVRIGRQCEVGPFTHLRDKAVLLDTSEVGNFVEVKKSRIGRHTKAKHLTYLGDAVIGNRTNIGAGTITANYDGRHKYKTVIGDKVFIGSHTTLIAPVTVGRGAVTGAGSVVLKGRNIPANTVVVGMPARVLKRAKAK